MQISGIYLDEVDIDKICPIYIETVSKSKQNKMVRILANGNSLSSHIIVEKDKTNDKFWLVAGYPEYLAYSKRLDTSPEVKEIPCVVQPLSNSTEQRITLLKRMLHHQTTYWIDKHSLISELIEKGNSINSIANRLGVETSVVETYLIHPDIPPEIIQLAKKNKGSFINIEQIRAL